MTSRALIVKGPHLLDIGEVRVPDPGAGEVLVKAAYSCVSPGTELRCLSGNDVTAWPYVPGYAMAGTVVANGPGTHLAAGTRVFCGGTERCSITRQWGAHLQYAVRTEAELLVLPEQVDMIDAAIARLAAIAHHGVRLCPPQQGERIAVVGLGPIGHLSARLHALAGGNVLGVDVAASRVARLTAAGVRAAVVTDSITAAVRAAFPDGAQMLVDATGVPSLIEAVLEAGADKPWDDSPARGLRYVIQGSYPDRFSVPYNAAFFKETSFYLPRDQQRCDMEEVIRLIAADHLPVRDLAEICDPEEAPQVFHRLQKRDADLMTVVFKWC